MGRQRRPTADYALIIHHPPAFLPDRLSRSILEHRWDVHHIFPRAYLKNDLGLRRAQYNQVANYAYTQQEINIAIGNEQSQKYIKKLVRQTKTKKPRYGGIISMVTLRKNFRENAVPLEFLSGNLFEYEDFLVARRECMADAIKEYYLSL